MSNGKPKPVANKLKQEYVDGSTKDLRRAFSGWLKQQPSQGLLVSIPKEAEAQLRTFNASVKGKVH